VNKELHRTRCFLASESVRKVLELQELLGASSPEEKADIIAAAYEEDSERSRVFARMLGKADEEAVVMESRRVSTSTMSGRRLLFWKRQQQEQEEREEYSGGSMSSTTDDIPDDSRNKGYQGLSCGESQFDRSWETIG